MKQILSFLILAVFLSSLSGCTGESSAQSSLPESRFVELNKGYFTENGISTKKQAKVISSQVDYAAELSNYTSATPASVDFTSGRVLLVDMGGRNTGGYSIDVTSVDVNVDSVVANIRLLKPGSGCAVTLSITNPYQFVFIPSLKEILLSERLEVVNC
jgi:protease stability complex PrcB-like protein